MTAINTDRVVIILPEDCGIAIFRICRKMTNKKAELATSISPACDPPLNVMPTNTTAVTKKAIQAYTITLLNIPREVMELSASLLSGFPIMDLGNCIRICNQCQ